MFPIVVELLKKICFVIVGSLLSLSNSALPSAINPDPISILLILICTGGVFLTVKILGLTNISIPFSSTMFVVVVELKVWMVTSYRLSSKSFRN